MSIKETCIIEKSGYLFVIYFKSSAGKILALWLPAAIREVQAAIFFAYFFKIVTTSSSIRECDSPTCCG